MTTPLYYFHVDYDDTVGGNFTFLNSTPAPPTIMAPMQFSPVFQAVVYILYNIVFVSAVIGNTLVIYVVLANPRMRTVTNYLIANLALGDLLLALLCVPFSYISVLLQYWPFGMILCHVVSPAQATCVFVSAYTLIALAVDRYVAILYPLRPRMRRSQALAAIGVVWIVAVVTAVPIALFTRLDVDEGRGNLPLCEESAWSSEALKLAYSLTLMVLQYFFPISVLIFTYTRIAIAVWGKKAPGEAEDARDQRLAKAKRKMIKMMLTVVGFYTISWLPLNGFIVLSTIYPEHPVFYSDTIAHVYLFLHLLAMVHGVVNPVVYCWLNQRFRDGFAVAVRRCGCGCRWLGVVESNVTGDAGRLGRSGTCTWTFGGANGSDRGRRMERVGESFV